MTHLELLAHMILHFDDIDYIEAYEEAATKLDADDAAALAAMLEICPIHHCDDAICRDDATCPLFNQEGTA